MLQHPSALLEIAYSHDCTAAITHTQHWLLTTAQTSLHASQQAPARRHQRVMQTWI
jgi:hypothetical protein